MFEKHWRWIVVACLSLTLTAVLPLAPASADSAPATTETTPEVDGGAEKDIDGEVDEAADNSSQAPGSGGGKAIEKLSVHGYLTQGFAEADFIDVPIGPNGQPIAPTPRGTEISLGIPEGGTSNYRFLALQFRYDMSASDIFVVQLSSRSLGVSPLQDFEDEVELDWAFYERRLTDNTSVKVGRVLIPIGIYNEVRDVGTVFPFYRPSFLFYKEGAFTTETVDGLSLAHTFAADSDWSVEATAYVGEWGAIERDPNNPEDSGITRAKDGYGAQLWLNTPVAGLRFGVGGFSFRSEGGPNAVVNRRDSLHASLDASLNRFVLQGEWVQEFDLERGFDGQITNHTEWYAMAGFRATEKFSIWAQLESGEVDIDNPVFLQPYGLTFREEWGVSLNFHVAPNIVLKAEHHWVEEDIFTLVPDFSTGAFRLINLGNVTLDGGTYSIVSLSVSF